MTICAACGLPGHRYGRNEGMERFDPIACINQLRGELEKRTLPGFTECPECGGEGIDRPEGCICPRFTDSDFRVADLTCRVHGVDGYVAQPDDDWERCPSCSGLGVVPDPETVEACARVLLDDDPAYSPPYWDDCDEGQKSWYRKQARAALLAYAQHTQETKP